MSLEKNVNILAGIDLTFEEFYLDFTKNYTMSKSLHKDALLLPYAKEIIKELAKKYTLFISTARNSLGIDVIKYILRKNSLLQYFYGYHFCYYFNDKMEFMKSPKTEFISSFNGKAAYFIDDSNKEIERTKSIIPSILLDTTGTRKVEGTWSLNGWREIGDIVL